MINFIGKDNIVFHCIVFPAMLMAYGDGFQLPDNVPANEFLNLEGDKISTSRNGPCGSMNISKISRASRTHCATCSQPTPPKPKTTTLPGPTSGARNNNELVAILGNFINRAVVLTHKYCGGCVPTPGELTDIDRQLFADARAAGEAITSSIENFHFREALKNAMELARLGNRYLQETEPWKVAKTDPARVDTLLWAALELCASIAVAFTPFTPFAAGRLAAMLGMGSMDREMIGSDSILAPGQSIGQPELLFDKISDEEIAAQTDRLERIKKENVIKNFKAEPQAPDVDFDTFCRSDIRVGTVLECSKVKKADKLLRFLIDDGMETRTIVSGIAKYYNPEDLIGKQVCFIANLPPRNLKGIESRGMILSAENADGTLTVIGPTAPVVPGAQVK